MRDHLLGWAGCIEFQQRNPLGVPFTPARAPMTEAEKVKRRKLDREKQLVQEPVNDRWNSGSPPTRDWYIVAGKSRIKNGIGTSDYMRFWNGEFWSLACPLIGEDRTKNLMQYARVKGSADQSRLMWLRKATHDELEGLEL